MKAATPARSFPVSAIPLDSELLAFLRRLPTREDREDCLLDARGIAMHLCPIPTPARVFAALLRRAIEDRDGTLARAMEAHADEALALCAWCVGYRRLRGRQTRWLARADAEGLIRDLSRERGRTA